MSHDPVEDATLGAIARATRNLELALSQRDVADRFAQVQPSQAPSTYKYVRFLANEHEIALPSPDFLRKLRSALHLRNDLVHEPQALETVTDADAAAAVDIIQHAADLVAGDHVASPTPERSSESATRSTHEGPAPKPLEKDTSQASTPSPTRLTRRGVGLLAGASASMQTILPGWRIPDNHFTDSHMELLARVSTSTDREEAWRAVEPLLLVLQTRTESLQDEVESCERRLMYARANQDTVPMVILVEIPLIAVWYSVLFLFGAFVGALLLSLLSFLGGLSGTGAPWETGVQLGASIVVVLLAVHEFRSAKRHTNLDYPPK